jgi:hypothetical protein
VELDRHVSLKGRSSGQESDEPPAGLYRLLCDQDVRLEDGLREGEQWKRFQRLIGRELLFDKSLNELNINGPEGEVLLLQTGGSSLTGPSLLPGQTAKEAGGDVPKLTWITYLGRMRASKITERATKIRFVDDVELVHLNAGDPDITISKDRLPPASLYLRCNQLEILTQKQADGRTTQDFKASEEVTVRSEPSAASGVRFHARADDVMYEEAKDQLVMVARPGNLVSLYRQKAPGGRFELWQARKFIYSRKDGTLKSDGTESIQGSP